jgi:hypothetical protein
MGPPLMTVRPKKFDMTDVAHFEMGRTPKSFIDGCRAVGVRYLNSGRPMYVNFYPAVGGVAVPGVLSSTRERSIIRAGRVREFGTLPPAAFRVRVKLKVPVE